MAERDEHSGWDLIATAATHYDDERFRFARLLEAMVEALVGTAANSDCRPNQSMSRWDVVEQYNSAFADGREALTPVRLSRWINGGPRRYRRGRPGDHESLPGPARFGEVRYGFSLLLGSAQYGTLLLQALAQDYAELDRPVDPPGSALQVEVLDARTLTNWVRPIETLMERSFAPCDILESRDVGQLVSSPDSRVLVAREGQRLYGLMIASEYSGLDEECGYIANAARAWPRGAGLDEHVTLAAGLLETRPLVVAWYLVVDAHELKRAGTRIGECSVTLVDAATRLFDVDQSLGVVAELVARKRVEERRSPAGDLRPQDLASYVRTVSAKTQLFNAWGSIHGINLRLCSTNHPRAGFDPVYEHGYPVGYTSGLVYGPGRFAALSSQIELRAAVYAAQARLRVEMRGETAATDRQVYAAYLAGLLCLPDTQHAE